MSTINALKWTSLTAAVNVIKSPNRFLQKLLYPNHQTLTTEDIELGTVTGGREIAPFVRKNGAAVMVGGTSKNFISIAGPNIRLKQAFTPSELLYGREPGTTILLDPGQSQIPAVEQHIARDLQFMADMVTNATEYLVAMSLQGEFQYILEDGEAITVTIPRSGSNNITMGTFLDDADPTKVRLHLLIHTVKEVMSEAYGLAPTDAICGESAAHQILELAESGNLKMLGQAGLQVSAGQLTFTQQFSDDGVIFLGELSGVRFWQYSRTASLNGSATAMIRTKYIEFISVSAASERVMYFAAIADMAALRGRTVATERFAKSWEVEDPSAMMSLLHSRPLPWPRKPDATVSVKAISG